VAARSSQIAPTVRFPTAVGIALFATAMFAACVGLRVAGPSTVLYVDDIGTLFAALAASLLCLRAGVRQVGALRRSWWLLGAACAAWTLGEVIWAVHDLALHDAVPVPSWADLGYLSAIPLAVAALLSHPTMAGSAAHRTRDTLDGLLVATALLFVSWTFVLGPLWHSTDLTTLGGLVALAYPFGDVVVLFFVLRAVRRMTPGNRLALWCLLAGLLALALSDSVYAYLTGVQGYEPGGLLDTGWFAGYLAIAVGASCSQAGQIATRDADSSVPAFTALIVSFVPILGALGVVAFKPDLVQELDPVAFGSAFALVGLVLARQLLVMRDVTADPAQGPRSLGEPLQAAAGAPAQERSEPPAPPRPNGSSR
jgi:hypothetical protein